MNQGSLPFRWFIFLREFDYDVEYIKGEPNPVDALSRTDPPVISAIKKSNHSLVLDETAEKRLFSKKTSLESIGNN